MKSMSSVGKSLPYFLYPAIGLLAGWGWGEMYSNKHEGRENSAESVSAAGSAKSDRDVLTRKEIFSEARKEVKAKELAKSSYIGDLNDLVKDWSDEEILAVLNEAALRPDAMLRYDSIARSLLGVFATRDPQRALEWVLAQPDIAHQKYADFVLIGFGPDRFEEALAMVKQHPDLFNRSGDFGFRLPYKVVGDGMTDAMNHGPEAFVSRLKELMDVGADRWTLGYATSVPDGFDFEAVLTSPDFKNLNLESTQKFLLTNWAAQDREAAFQWLLQNQGIGEINSLNQAWWDQATPEGVGFIQWAVAKVESSTPEQREVFLEKTSQDLLSGGVDFNTWIDAAKEPEFKESLRALGVKRIIGGQNSDVESGLSALETYPDLESRLSALEAFAMEPGRGKRMSFPDWEKLVRNRLAEWGADSTRVDGIVKGLKNEKPSKPNP